MADVAPVETTMTTTRKRGGRKPGVRKVATPKSTSGGARAKSKPAGFSLPRFETPSFDKLGETVKEVAYAQLGIYGKVYDEVNSRVEKARKAAPKRWDTLVKRGEKVQRDFERAQKDLRSDFEKRQKDLRADLQERFDDLQEKVDIEGQIEKVRDAVSKLTQRVRKAA